MHTLRIAEIRNEESHQLTTFNLDKRSKTIHIKPGERVTVGEVKGKGYISQFWMTFPGWFWMHWAPDNEVFASILKTLIIRIYWDGEDTPAVAVPAGDFFGVGLCEYSSFAGHYFGMSSGGFYCKFPMIFNKSFRIELENRDPNIGTDVFMNVMYQTSYDLNPELGFFHAQFRTGQDCQEVFETADIQGAGHYAGCTLSMQGKRLNDLSFLEAPEYIYTDADTEKPRIVGTGLEDYFLGGWYFREGPFAGALHGVPVKDSLRSSVAMYRVHVDDAIRFSRRFRFTFTHPWDAQRINPFFFSSASFFFLDTAKGQPEKKYSVDELLGMYRVRDVDHQSIP